MNFEQLVKNALWENTTISAYKKQGGSGLMSGLVTNTGVYSTPNTGTSAQVFTSNFTTRGTATGPLASQTSSGDFGEDITTTKNLKKDKSKGPSLKDCFKTKVSFSKYKQGRLANKSSKKSSSTKPLDKEGENFFQ